MIAGFQYDPPNSIGAAVDAPAIALLMGPALGATMPWAKRGHAQICRHATMTTT